MLIGGECSPDVAAVQMKIFSCRQPCTLDLGRSRALERNAVGIEIPFALCRQRNVSDQRTERTPMDDAEAVVAVGLKTERVEIGPPAACVQGSPHAATRPCDILLKAPADTRPSSSQKIALLSVEATRNCACNVSGANEPGTSG